MEARIVALMLTRPPFSTAIVQFYMDAADIVLQRYQAMCSIKAKNGRSVEYNSHAPQFVLKRFGFFLTLSHVA